MMKMTMGRAATSLLAMTLTGATAAQSAKQVRITTLSTDAARVTGGDVLVQVEAAGAAGLKIKLNGRDVTTAFRAGKKPETVVGLVTGLVDGKNMLRAGKASLEITNYPITGPVFSGPQQKPFICQTDKFALPDGTLLGAPLDANCSVKTVVQYMYLPKGGTAFKPLPSTTVLPPNVATTITTTGDTVRFIVRVETGTMDRGIYQNAILHDPTIDPPVSPFFPPRGWNRKLIAIHGSGCVGGWYVQGAAMGVNPLDRTRLGQGYALFTNTLNHPTNSCNAILAAETTMMGKEHFIETFGVPEWTMSTGGSGGAYTSLQVADAFPGLIDGVMISATFPDALAIAMSGLDAHLLMHYVAQHPGKLSDTQLLAVGGYSSVKAMTDAANQAQRTDPVPDRADIAGYQSARFNRDVPETLRYDPVSHPRGARPTIFDEARNVYGVNRATGAALRPYDNTGVQYGLEALEEGSITPAQFLDLNEKIGGVDADDNYTAARSVGDAEAIRRTYQSGLMLSGGGGLASIPIVDDATSNEAGSYHYGWFHFALRERLIQANGNAGNMMMWRSAAPGLAREKVFDEWMKTWKAEESNESQRAKVLKARPATAKNGCYEGPRFIAEELVFSSKPTSECSTRYPVYSNPRKEAGGPLAANVLKCQLKPVDPAVYKVRFTAAEIARLHAVFAGGVCDFTKPGVNQVPLVTWPSFGPSPVHLIYDVNKP